MSDEAKSQSVEAQEDESVHKGLVDAKGKRQSPWSWVPTIYYAEGIPYIVAQTVSVIMYKRMGVSNTNIAFFTSLLYFPWVIKPLWSPIVDILKTKRWWIVLMQLILSGSLASVGMTVPLPGFFKLTLICFLFVAFASATHDIACDGFYMLGLTKHQQAWYVGIRSSFYRLAMLTGQGLLVIVAGFLEGFTGLPPATISVDAIPDSKAKIEIVRFIEQTADEKAFVEKKIPLEIVQYYEEKAKQSKNLEELMTYANFAEGIVKKIKQDTPESPDISKAEELLKSISGEIDKTIENQIEEMANSIKPLDGDLRVFTSTENLKIPIQQISKTDSDLTISTVKKWNLLQGQKEQQAVVVKAEKKKEPGKISKLWSSNVAVPLGNFLRKNWGQEKKELSTVAGSVGYVYFHLSKPPEQGKDVTVIFGRSEGDKSIELKEGMRFIFNDKNWNKPARTIIQLDYRLKDKSNAIFLATAGNIPKSWAITFYMISALFFIFCIYHFFRLPYPQSDTSRYEESHKSGNPLKIIDILKEFFTTFVSFFQKKGIFIAIIYLLLYRFGEAQLVKLSSPFLLDSKEVGGLALTPGKVGIAYGIFGLIFLSFGGILGGFVASRDGLKKWLWPMAFAITLPHLAYVYLSFATPENFLVICACVSIETFGYGFGFTAYMLYMIFIAEGKHKTAHFAIATGFMAMSMMIPGTFSGWIQSIIGYKNFFIWIMLASLPTWIVVFFIPIDPEFGKKSKKAS